MSVVSPHENVIALSHPVCLARLQNLARYIVGARWTLGCSIGYKQRVSVHRLVAKSFKSHEHAFFLSRPPKASMEYVYIKSSERNQEMVSMNRIQY